MAKNKIQAEEEVIIEKKKSNKLVWLFLVVVVLVGGDYFYYNGEILINRAAKAIAKATESDVVSGIKREDEITILGARLAIVENKLLDVANQQSAMPKIDIREEVGKVIAKYEAMEKQNLNVIDSKADVAVVLGLLTRIDRLEKAYDKMSETSDDGALILSATMLIKERAERGDRFEYEANVLKILSEKIEDLREPVEDIVKLSSLGVVSDNYLIGEFERLYNESLIEDEVVEEDLSWKERLKAKFSEVIKIRRTDEAGMAEKKEPAITNVQKIKNYVAARMFEKAIDEIEKNNIEGYNLWISEAKDKIAFDKAVSKISAYSLASMKINHIRN